MHQNLEGTTLSPACFSLTRIRKLTRSQKEIAFSWSVLSGLGSACASAQAYATPEGVHLITLLCSVLLKVVGFLLVLQDPIVREAAQGALTPWKTWFCWRAACFHQEDWKPSCWGPSSHSVDKVTPQNGLFLRKHGTERCCFALNTVSCPASCRAGMRCPGGLYNFLSQIPQLWQTPQWVGSYVYICIWFLQILRQAGRKPMQLIP